MNKIRTNIYLAYTPFHILLASAIASSRREEVNRLLVVRNFADSDNFLGMIKLWEASPFRTIEIYPGEYGQDKHSKFAQRWYRYYTVRKNCHDILRYCKENNGDHFYLFNAERPQSLYLTKYLEKVKQQNGFKVFYVEDGASTYSSIVVPKKWHYIFLGKVFYGPWWTNVEIMGEDEVFDAVKAIFPRHVRPELRHKKIEPIDLSAVIALGQESFLEDYFDKYQLKTGDLKKLYGIILLPHSSILEKEASYKEILIKLTRHLSEQGHTIAIKYHPRDNGNDPLGLGGAENVYILNAAIPVELIYLAAPNLRFIISDSSTTLMSALWSLKACKIISLGELVGKKDEIFNQTLRELGVLLPTDFKGIEYVLST